MINMKKYLRIACIFFLVYLIYILWCGYENNQKAGERLNLETFEALLTRAENLSSLCHKNDKEKNSKETENLSFEKHRKRFGSLSTLCAKIDEVEDADEILNRETFRELLGRSTRISALCAKNENVAVVKTQINVRKERKTQNRKVPSQLLIMPEKRLAWCMVPKAASSSIANAIVEINDMKSLLSDIHQPHNFLREVYKNADLTLFHKEPEQFISFYIARHPFHRIVSAYKNKLENASVHDGPYFFQHYGKKIVQSFRSKTQNESKAKMEPTFEEFILYLLNTKPQKYDLHWKPITLFCDVCHYSYNFTIKFENFETEFEAMLIYLISQNYLPDDFSIEYYNKGIEKGQSDNVSKTYMGKLPKMYVKQLYEIYKTDFIYFEYDFTGYL